MKKGRGRTTLTKKPMKREAVRAILLTPDGQVLLIRVQEPVTGREFWCAPGGGRQEEESPEVSLRREIAEETGLEEVVIGPPLWTRRHTFDWAGMTISQEETYYLVHTEWFCPTMKGNPEPIEMAAFREFRWWTTDEIAASVERFAPRRLAEHLRFLIRCGPPEKPFDSGP